jgi:hypothetical protein
MKNHFTRIPRSVAVLLLALLMGLAVVAQRTGNPTDGEAPTGPAYVQTLYQDLVMVLQNQIPLAALQQRSLTPELARQVGSNYVDLFGQERAGHPDTVAAMFLKRSGSALSQLRSCQELRPANVSLDLFEEDGTGSLHFCRLVLRIKTNDDETLYEVGAIRINNYLHLVHFGAIS